MTERVRARQNTRKLCSFGSGTTENYMFNDIEYLLSEIDNLKVHADYCESKAIGYEAECKDLQAENEKLKETNKALESDIYNAQMNLSLTAQEIEAKEKANEIYKRRIRRLMPKQKKR